ncbi:MAG: Serine dehydrogenase proteinase [Candidatus Atribacteria bacterium ADurb.Bin276]|uniref:Serine dehydrogenase proteinase n=1 Tax=Candidatus Atribacter allofermentans TaxID=1852833 RepID=A0A1V5T5F2_9BACT|nr:MAG: Serine dehydrogenase proteinase [Candidatus Atribacteria bacterium ADurb.Bin276]
MREFQSAIKDALDARIVEIERQMNSDVITLYGAINTQLEYMFPSIIEKLKGEKTELSIILETPGGSAEIVEHLVNIIRYHYNKVNFIIPNQAMSAGTIFAMSGNKIFMEYSSVLGPIDPQVWNGQNWVPALGYLEKYKKLMDKASEDKISDAEFALLCKLDLAEISNYEQQSGLTVTLLKKWLVKYKFENWGIHQSDPELKGQPVTHEQKEKRAEEIATDLGNNERWHSHNRKIDLKSLQELKLYIDDYSEKEQLRNAVRRYFEMMLEYVLTNNVVNFVHHRNYI